MSKTPLPEYPRPQMQRERWLTLNGEWKYAVTQNHKTIPNVFDSCVLVPYSIETPLSGVCKKLLPDETLWYQRVFSLPQEWKNERVLLNFEAVDWSCCCFINGKKVGVHKGGYLPFSFNVTEYLHKADNEIILSVKDPTDTVFNQCGKQTLNPKTMFYTATSGIWQSVWLEPVNTINYIVDYKLETDIETGILLLKINTLKKCKLHILIKTQENVTVLTQEINSNVSEIIKINETKLWSPKNPHLYAIEIDINDVGSDHVKGYFAFRKISIKDTPSGKKIFLNNEPIFLHAPLDQGYWPQSGLTPPSEEAILFDLNSIKELGFNSVRKHIKIEPRRWYFHADRLGLLVIQDMVSGGRNMVSLIVNLAIMIFNFSLKDNSPKAYKKSGRSSPQNRSFFEEELKAVINHLYNHPSIIMWTIFNESWGQFDSERIGKLVETIDKTRLVDRTSGWFDQGGNSFRSLHTYFFKLFKPPKKDKRLYYISEYGGYNMKVKGHLWNENKNYGYKSCNDSKKLERYYKNLIQKQLIPLIKKGLGAAVYTQLTDVEIETNGFFTYDRSIFKNKQKTHKKP